MSWSVAAIGNSGAVAEAIAQQFTNSGKCNEPEEAIRQAAAKIIADALAAEMEDTPVDVSASGSMSWSGNQPVSNQVSISIKPIWGFIK
jgi:hypothetical protein